jgi:hypothetical protein
MQAGRLNPASMVNQICTILGSLPIPLQFIPL